MKKQHYKLERLHVLLVEDSSSMRMLVSEILKEIGVGRVSTATSGQMAMNYLEPAARNSLDEVLHFDLVISDWVMEPVSGLELLNWIRKHKSDDIRYLPFIMLSGYGDQAHIIKARDAGITEFMAKPVSVKTIVRYVLNVIDKPRPFIVSENYIGPDRRRRNQAIEFPDRRENKSTDTTAAMSPDAKVEEAT